MSKDKKISRKEAIKKMGKYAAITAIGTFIILNPQKAQADSPSGPDDGDLFPNQNVLLVCNLIF